MYWTSVANNPELIKLSCRHDLPSTTVVWVEFGLPDLHVLLHLRYHACRIALHQYRVVRLYSKHCFMRYIYTYDSSRGSAELNHPLMGMYLVQQWFKNISAGMKCETVLFVWNLKCSSGVSGFRHASSRLGICPPRESVPAPLVFFLD